MRIVPFSLFLLGLCCLTVSGGGGRAVAQATATPSATLPVPPASAPPDVLVFTNGDKLTGKLERASGGNVFFKSDMAGELTIPFSKVKELQSGTEFVALPKGVPGKIKPSGTGVVTVSDNTLHLQKGSEPVQVLPVADLGFLIDVPSYSREVDHEASFRQGWNGSATAGLTLVRSTESSTVFTGALNLVRTIPSVAYLPNRNRTTLNAAESYGTNRSPVIGTTLPPSIVKTNIFHADGERDQYFSARFYVLGDLSFDHNFSQGLQLQQVYGLGAGWTPFQDANQQLDLRADVHYERQQFFTAGDLNLIGSTFQENYHRNLPRKLVLTEWANFLPSWNDTRAYSANAYVGLALPVIKRISANLSATDNYLNNPSPGYRTNSVQFVTGLTYLIK